LAAIATIIVKEANGTNEMKQTLFILFLLFSNLVFANTIEVGKDQLITSLRKGIELANDGDTILLHKGIYREGNIIINKSIHLIGINAPVLDGENKYEILTVSGERILIKGIHFRNSGYSSMNDYASISLVDARYAIIENNTIEHGYFGIHVANASHCIIRENKITGTPKTEQTSGNAIHLWKCDNMIVESNDVQGHRDGIYFEFVTHSYISQNNSHHNIRYGLHFMFSNNDTYMENLFEENGAGVAVMYSNHVLMYGNTFKLNWGPNAYGLLLKEISDGQIINNRFDENTAAIQMESTNRIEVQSNDFKNNGWALRISASCDENTLHHNNFSANTFDVATNGTMMLNQFYNNYWDKYDGYDMNKDGIGDVPYHPVSMYSMVIEQNPNSLLLLRSFMVSLLDKAEKAIPSLTPENLVDKEPLMRKANHDQN
jgi:nitrous oxidase accessory protein